MKFLKKYEAIDFKNEGILISHEEVEECFEELKDDDWIIRINYDSKFVDPKVDNQQGRISMSFVPFLQIRILKFMKSSEIFQQLMDSNEYKEAIARLKDRLEEYDHFIKTEHMERITGGGYQINILIYRKTDENLIK